MATPYADWRLTSPGGIKHSLISQTGGFAPEDADWTMVIRIRGQDLVAFVQEVFPLPVFTIFGFVYPHRFYPAGLPALSAKGLQVEGFTSGRPIDPFNVDPLAPDGTYEEFLKVTINFGTAPENDTPDQDDPFTFLEISGNASGEFLTAEINGDAILWEDEAGETEGRTEQDPPTEQRVSSSLIEWSVKWSQISHAWFGDTLLPRLRSMMGKVNSNPVTVFRDPPAETVLFLSFSMQQQHTWREGYAGASPITLDLKFLEKNFQSFIPELETDSDSFSSASSLLVPGTPDPPHGAIGQVTHNHMWRPNMGWMRLLVNGNPIYEQDDLNTLFQP